MIAALIIASSMAYPYSWAPGAIDSNCTAEDACKSGYTATVRPDTAMTDKIKKNEILAHQEIDCSKGCELDHVISLELCGAPSDVMNLAIEPYFPKPGAREKDQAEDFLHRQVCKGNMTLQEAQELVRTDWLEIYQNLQKNKKKK